MMAAGEFLGAPEASKLPGHFEEDIADRGQRPFGAFVGATRKIEFRNRCEPVAKLLLFYLPNGP
jgi:hypothetical protein